MILTLNVLYSAINFKINNAHISVSSTYLCTQNIATDQLLRSHNFLLKLLPAKTNNSFNLGQEYKRYIFRSKTGVVKPKGIFIYHLFLIKNYFLQTFLLGIPTEKWYLLLLVRQSKDYFRVSLKLLFHLV